MTNKTPKLWQDLFSLRDKSRVPTDFMNRRPLNEPLKPRAFRKIK
jgi:hypothetical protein